MDGFTIGTKIVDPFKWNACRLRDKNTQGYMHDIDRNIIKYFISNLVNIFWVYNNNKVTHGHITNHVCKNVT